MATAKPDLPRDGTMQVTAKVGENHACIFRVNRLQTLLNSEFTIMESIMYTKHKTSSDRLPK